MAAARTPFFVALCALTAFSGCGEHGQPVPEGDAPRAPASALYAQKVQPVFESRCAVCHGCYDSPCQLELTSHAGVDRGASKQPVYESSRLLAAEPTRLSVDAHTASEWRERGFHTVLGSSESPSDALLLRMLALGRAHPLEQDARLPDTLPLDIERKLECAASPEFDAYAEKNPGWGMPYGMAPLTDDELGAITGWVRAGAPPPLPPAALSPALRAQVESWEAFLNGDTLKQHVVSRYLYEHWFLGHLYFAEAPAGPFFRVLRSSTPPGQEPDEIPTRRPYDDPKVAFWYRLEPIDGALLHKTHITYRLDAAKRERLTQLFLGDDWQPTRFPSYERDVASNPFEAFAEMPARARYQFLLDDSRFFVMNFIRGPVCYGQVAVNVIEDRFFVMFVDPDHDVSVQDPTFLAKAAPLLSLPAEHGSETTLGQLWLNDDLDQARYLRLRQKRYTKLDPKMLGPTLDWIWDGDGSDPDAQLTVFRHFDNAAVLYGFVGDYPKTAWMMDFPIFERIYYDLVAGFDVFGNVTHQIATRLYMDHLRMQSEDTLLAFLPPAMREPLRDSWYQGATKDLTVRLVDRVRDKRGTQIHYSSQDVLPELLAQVLERARAAAGPPDLLNRCPGADCDRPDATPAQRDAERALRRVTKLSAPFVQTLPELTLVRLAVDGAVYSLTRDVYHTNVAFLFDESSRLRPELDQVTVVRGVAGSYPNFVFVIGTGEASEFVDALLAVRDDAGLDALVKRWGVRRSSPRFWSVMDAVNGEQKRSDPTEAARLDLNRYKNL